MVFMAMGKHDADQIVEPFLDESEVGQDDIDAGIMRVGEGDAAIDHQPLAVTAIEIDVHGNLARSAECDEQEFFVGSHLNPVFEKIERARSASAGAIAGMCRGPYGASRGKKPAEPATIAPLTPFIAIA